MDSTADLADLWKQTADSNTYKLYKMAQRKKQKSCKKTKPLLPREPFPFMSLPPEIRLMVYDILMPKEVCLTGGKKLPRGIAYSYANNTGLPVAVNSLMKIKEIRSELAPHLFARQHFVWFDSAVSPNNNRRWESLKHYAIPFLKTFTFWASLLLPKPDHSTKLFLNLLKWMRWRSLRSHLHPWHLKNLTLAQPYNPPQIWRRELRRRIVHTDHDADDFFMVAPVVPGLDSLDIVLPLPTDPSEEPIKVFLQRCANHGVKGRVGYWHPDREEVAYWLQLQDSQIVWIDAPRGRPYGLYQDGEDDEV